VEISKNALHHRHLTANGPLNLHLSGEFWPLNDRYLIILTSKNTERERYLSKPTFPLYKNLNKMIRLYITLVLMK